METKDTSGGLSLDWSFICPLLIASQHKSGSVPGTPGPGVPQMHSLLSPPQGLRQQGHPESEAGRCLLYLKPRCSPGCDQTFSYLADIIRAPLKARMDHKTMRMKDAVSKDVCCPERQLCQPVPQGFVCRLPGHLHHCGYSRTQ